MPRRLSDPPQHPDLGQVSILTLLGALADRTRLSVVEQLLADGDHVCGTFNVDVAHSTLSHHLKLLREAGVIRQWESGRNRMTALREADLNEHFPGLLDAVMARYTSDGKEPDSITGPPPSSIQNSA